MLCKVVELRANIAFLGKLRKAPTEIFDLLEAWGQEGGVT